MAKDLHGRAIIELTDVKTGAKESYTYDNMITSALDKLIPAFCMGQHIQVGERAFFPLVEKAMGGIYLFNNALTENANNIWLPNVADAKLVGYAGHATSDGKDNMRGDFNFIESGEITNGYKLVWDFGTDDANGDIAALALTNHIAGFHGYHYNPHLAISNADTYTGSESNNYKGNQCGILNITGDYSRDYEYVSYDEETKELIRIIKTTTTNINVEHYRLTYTNINLIDRPYNIQPIRTDNVTISDTNLTETNRIVWIDGENGFYYGIFGVSGNVIKICKLNKATLEYTAATTYTISDNRADLKYIMRYYLSNSPTCTPCAVIRNGYLYALRHTNGQVAKIPLNNPTEITYIAGTEYTPAKYNNSYLGYEIIYKDKNGNIVTNSAVIGNDDSVVENWQEYGLVRSTDSGAYYVNQYIRYMGNNIHMNCLGYSSSSYSTIGIAPNMQYLATINNLDTPVQKTAAKTMKITYTLTYAD